MSVVNGLYTNFYTFSGGSVESRWQWTVSEGLFRWFEDGPVVCVPAYKAGILVFPLKI